jgi:hypothetical protein
MTRLRCSADRWSFAPRRPGSLTSYQNGGSVANVPAHPVPYRLWTTLTDPQAHPALDLVRLYHQRWEIERCINKLKSWRGIATRFDKTPESYSAGLHLRGSIIWLRSLTEPS